MKVKIGYKEYEIIKQPEIIEIKGDYYGKTETDEEKITIASKFSQKVQNQTFLHELLHCIASKYDLPVNQDEHTIQVRKYTGSFGRTVCTHPKLHKGNGNQRQEDNEHLHQHLRKSKSGIRI